MTVQHVYPVLDVLRVVDGDTVDLRLDVGFYMTGALRFRFYGIDTPELRSPDPEERAKAVEARGFVVQWAGAHATDLEAHTHKADSFGRWLVELECVSCGARLNDALLAAGYAVPWSR